MNDMVNVALVVPSCDKYSDLWGPFFQLLNIYWQDCPYKIYLISNHQDPHVNNVTTLKVGDDISWSDNLTRALGMIEEDYVLLFLEDLFFASHVDTQRVLAITNWAIRVGANYIRLNPYPSPDIIINPDIGEIAKGAIYRTSTVISLWKKAVLNDLLKPGENAWQFETDGSKRSDKYNQFYSTLSFHICVINAVIKSKWCTEAIKLAKKNGIDPDLSLRDRMTFIEEYVYFMRKVRSYFFRKLPNVSRRMIKDLLIR